MADPWADVVAKEVTDDDRQLKRLRQPRMALPKAMPAVAPTRPTPITPPVPTPPPAPPKPPSLTKTLDVLVEKRSNAVRQGNNTTRAHLTQLGVRVPPLPEGISPDEEAFYLQRFLAEADPVLKAKAQESFERMVPWANVNRPIMPQHLVENAPGWAQPIVRGVREMTSPMMLGVAAATAGVGPAIAAPLRAAAPAVRALPFVGRVAGPATRLAAGALDPIVGGGFVPRMAAESALGVGAVAAGDYAGAALPEGTPPLVRTGVQLGAGLVGAVATLGAIKGAPAAIRGVRTAADDLLAAQRGPRGQVGGGPKQPLVPPEVPQQAGVGSIEEAYWKVSGAGKSTSGQHLDVGVNRVAEAMGLSPQSPEFTQMLRQEMDAGRIRGAPPSTGSRYKGTGKIVSYPYGKDQGVAGSVSIIHPADKPWVPLAPPQAGVGRFRDLVRSKAGQFDVSDAARRGDVDLVRAFDSPVTSASVDDLRTMHIQGESMLTSNTQSVSRDGDRIINAVSVEVKRRGLRFEDSSIRSRIVGAEAALPQAGLELGRTARLERAALSPERGALKAALEAEASAALARRPPVEPPVGGVVAPVVREGAPLIGQFTDTEAVVALTSRPDIYKKIASQPGMRTLLEPFKVTSPESSVGRKYVVARAHLGAEVETLAQTAMAPIDSLGGSSKVFGQMSTHGLLEEGPFKGLTVNTLAANPTRYATRMTEAQRQFVTRIGALQDELERALMNEDILVNKLTFEEGRRYIGSRVFAKDMPDGTVATFGVRAGPQRPGAKLAFEKHKWYDTPEDAIAAGCYEMPVEDALRLNVEGGLNKIADKRMAEWVFANADHRTASTSEGIKLAREAASRKLQSARSAITALQRAKRGEQLPTGTVKAIERVFPDLLESRNLRETTKVSVKNVLEAAKTLEQPERVLQVPHVGTLMKYRKLLAAAEERLALNPGDPVLQKEVSQLSSRLGFTKYRIKLGEPMVLPHQPVKELRREAVQELDELIDAIRGTRIGKTQRFQGGLIDDVLADVRATQLKLKIAGEQAAVLRAGEGAVPAPAFGGKIFTGPGGDEIAATIKRSMDPSFSKTLGAVNQINAVSRYFMLAGDVSPMLIQLLFLAGGNPKAYVKAGYGFARALRDPMFHATYLAKAEHMALAQKYPITIFTRQGGTEFTEFARTVGRLAESPRGVVRAGATLPAKALSPFQRGFEASMDVAGMEMLASLDHLGTTAARRADLAQFVNEFRGLTSLKRIGVSFSMSQKMTATMLAPRYNAAIAALLFDTTRGGLRGSLARQHLARGIAAVVAASVGISYAMGESHEEVLRHLNPSHPKFLTWEVAGQNVGPGSKVRSVLKLFGASANNPENLTSIDVGWGRGNYIKNPLINFVRGLSSPVVSTAWDLLTGKNYIGDPSRDGLLSFTKTVAENFMPIWFQAVLFEGGDIQQRAIRGAAEFFGGRAYPANIMANLWTEWKGDTDAYYDIATTKEGREEKGQRLSRDDFRKKNPEVDAKLFILGKVTTLKTSRAKAIARQLLAEHNVLSYEVDPKMLETFSEVLGIDAIDKLKREVPLVPADDQFPEPFEGGIRLGPVSWNDTRSRLDSSTLKALSRVWYEHGTLTEQERRKLKTVHAEMPMGQPNFNTWVKQTLRQKQENASQDRVRQLAVA